MSEFLVITSKIKKYAKETHELRTSEDTVEALSKMVREALDKAAVKAKEDKRKTVQARDFE